MDKEEIRQATKEQLLTNVENWKKEIIKLKIQRSRDRKSDKPHMFKELRKNIARAYTFMQQKTVKQESE